MRALVLADRRPNIDFAAVCADEQVDAVFLLGDLDFFMLPGLADVSLPKAGVYGNHCRDDYLPQVGAVNCHLRRFRLGPVTVGGLEGCPIYKAHGEHQYSAEQVRWMLGHLKRCDILLTHCPPRGMNLPGLKAGVSGQAGA